MLVLTRSAGQSVVIGKYLMIRVGSVTSAGNVAIKVYRTHGSENGGEWVEDGSSPHMMRRGDRLDLTPSIALTIDPRQGPTYGSKSAVRSVRLGITAPADVDIVRDDAILRVKR